MALMIHHFAQEQLQAAEQAAGSWNPAALRQETERLLQIYPEFAPALDRLAALQEEAGEYPDALHSRQRAVMADPASADLWIRLAGLQHRRLQQTRPAIQSLKRALALDAAHPEAAVLFAELERAGRSAKR
jgi:tetratricopeptide (TPR) repeat protein